MKRQVLLSVLNAVLIPALFAQPGLGSEVDSDLVRESPTSLIPKIHRVGELIPDLSFEDVDGKKGKLSDYEEQEAIVIAMQSVDCPLSKKFTPVLGRIAEAYESLSVTVLIVNPMEHEAREKIQAWRKKTDLKPRYISDGAGVFGRALGALTTTDVFVLDRSRTLIYRGAVSDQYGLGYSLDAARSNYLKDALEAILEERSPEVEATTAPGCALDLPEPGRKTKKSEVTYHNRISRILQRNCQECHRPGEAGPFDLLTYEDAKGHGAMIRRVVEGGTMPPWFSSDQEIGKWGNDRRLAPQEKKDLLTWIANKAPEGDPKDAPLDRNWTEGWTLGEPDEVLRLPLSMDIPAEGTVPYRYIKLRNRFDEDRWVRAMEIRPTAPENVHHVLVFLTYPKDHPRAKDQPEYRGGRNGFFAGMVPGQSSTVYSPHLAKFIPRGAELTFQVHYTTNGVRGRDRTQLGLYYADEAPTHEVITQGVSNPRLRIPPQDPNYESKAQFKFRQDSRILSLLPHMHVRGKAFRYDLVYPDGKSVELLNVPTYDFNWQLIYQLQEPLDVPKGTVMNVTAWYDNSPGNPANPNPNTEVRFGEQTWEEMLIGYFDWHVR